MTDSLSPITGTEVNSRSHFGTRVLGGRNLVFPELGSFACMLQKVTHRKPVPFQPHAHIPEYLLAYVVETLACGHQLTIYPQADSLIAVRRDCPQCGLPVPKKKPYSVVSTRSEVHKIA